MGVGNRVLEGVDNGSVGNGVLEDVGNGVLEV